MSSNASGKIDAWLAIGFGAGLYYFYKGFRVFREYRVLMDTPEVPIRSVAMGLVDIHGKATGAPPITSPVTQAPCYFYKVDIEHWVQGRNGGSWQHLATDADGKRFYLADSTGKVLVDAHQAEYDLVQTARVETQGGLGSGLGRLLSGIGGGGNGAGAAGVRPDLAGYVSTAVSRQKGHGIFGSNGPFSGLMSGSGRYRLTEYLVVPDHWYDLTGTCVENPQPQDEHDRNMIVKGSNEPTFLISWRSEQEIRRTLRNRAMKYIFGGSILAVVCLGLLLAKYGAF